MSKQDDDELLSPFSSEPTGGRYLLAGLFIFGLVLISIIGLQTRPAYVGQTLVDGGWWSEPYLAPAVALVILIVSSLVAVLVTRREKLDLPASAIDYLRVFLISAWMLAAVWMISQVGFALAVLIFSSGLAGAAGFRGRKLLFLTAGTTLAMVLVFRVGFSIWFPRPWLFKVIDLGSPWTGWL